MGVSRSRRPSWTNFRAAMAATGLLIDAAWNSVTASTGSRVATLATPYPLAHSIWCPENTASDTPGTSNAFITSTTTAEIASILA